ncbi:MAG: APC family permease [Burkholderiales bacterium]|nr:APC family permease [Burkholderiales bacterium]
MDRDERVTGPTTGEAAAIAPRAQAPEAAPRPMLSVADGVFLMIGMIVGVGIFKAPSVVAGASASGAEFLLAWLLGGVVSLCGALVYAELAARHPDTGGEYRFLERGLGRAVAFLFAWSRMTVIQTGAIVAVAFVFGDYASTLVPLGKHSAAIYAAIGVVAFTALNVAGTLPTKNLQRWMETVLIAGLLALAAAGLIAGAPGEPAPAAGGSGAFGLAMIFVLLTYGGWNEAAYLAGEVREPRRNMRKVLVIGIVAVTLLYLLVNLGYLAALGLSGMRESKAVAADVMKLVAGEAGAAAVALLVCVSALTTMNAAIFTGARTTWAFSRDFAAFGRLGRWRAAGSTPANALLLQGAISLVLVLAGAFTPDGFSAMVAYTSPVFWTFFLLTGLTLFVFRARETRGELAYPETRVPLFPLVPLVFVGACLYMLWSSVDYVRNPEYGPKFGAMVLAGLAVMAAGVAVYAFARRGAPRAGAA